jgi:hypothetical protein
VTIFEALHDMARPVEALRAARALLAKGGSVLVADERAGERFTAPAEDPLDRLFYGFSVLHCLPVGRVDQPSAATGTVMRPHPLRSTRTPRATAGPRSCRSSTTSGASTASSPDPAARRSDPSSSAPKIVEQSVPIVEQSEAAAHDLPPHRRHVRPPHP